LSGEAALATGGVPATEATLWATSSSGGSTPRASSRPSRAPAKGGTRATAVRPEKALLGDVVGIALAPNGDLYLTDMTNARIRGVAISELGSE
jgi:hypothetical protein